MKIPYKDWPEEKKEKAREAVRNWAARHDRSEYYKKYEREGRSLEKKEERKEIIKKYHQDNAEEIYAKRKSKYYSLSPEQRADYYKKKSREKNMLQNAKRRAKDKGLPFSITLEDIKIPSNCPVCGREIVTTNTKHEANSCSFDKVVPSIGYVPGNVAVICHECNTIKSFGDAKRHRQIADYIDSFI